MPSKRKSECTPEEWAAHLQYIREWRLKNLEGQNARKRAYQQRPEVREKRLAYNALPSTKKRKAERDRTPESIAKAKARQSSPEARLKKLIEQRRRRTGFTEALVRDLLVIQNGCCAICGTAFEDPKKIRSDHCHASNTPRGLLCHPCNIIEGFMSRLPLSIDEFARKLTEYLANPPAAELKLPSPPS